jgi:hypothetical protein
LIETINRDLIELEATVRSVEDLGADFLSTLRIGALKGDVELLLFRCWIERLVLRNVSPGMLVENQDGNRHKGAIILAIELRGLS